MLKKSKNPIERRRIAAIRAPAFGLEGMFRQELPSNPSAKEFRVATYNLHGWIGSDRRRNPQRVVQVIRALKSSIIALQEVTLELGDRHGSENFLAASTGLRVISGPTLYNERGSYGNVLLTEHPVRGVRRLDISQPGREPRGALEAELLVHGRPVFVLACHLGLRELERRRQMQMLLEFMRPLTGKRVILMGDFNEWRPRSRILGRLNRLFGCLPSPCTFPARLPVLALDRIWASPISMLKKVSVYNTPLARTASDHLPLKAALELP